MLLHIRKLTPSPYPLFPGLVKICIELNLGPDQTSNSCPCVQPYTPQPVTTGQSNPKIPGQDSDPAPQATKNNNKKSTKTSLRSHSHKKLFLPEIILFLPSRFLKCVWVKRLDNFTNQLGQMPVNVHVGQVDLKL